LISIFMSKKIKQPPSVSPELLSWMREIRRTIHQNPELSFEEFATADYITEKLDEIGVSSHHKVAGTGIIVEIGPADASLIVGLRADMDALPIQEETGLSYASKNAGIMHACGHDGHAAMLLGAASLLQKMDIPGRVRLLFQPAEENGNGAKKMMKAGAIDDLAAIFGGHIDTHYETGIITVDKGIICAYADPFVIRLTGSSGHAARPHECKDAIVAAAGLITSLQSLVSREADPNHAAVLTVGKIRAGEIHNVIAGDAVIEGTIRSTYPAARERLLLGLERMVEATANYHGVHGDLQFPEALPAVINDSAGTEVAQQAARGVVGAEQVISQGPSSLGGEDFAFYLQKMQGCLVRFGAKVSDETGPAHNPTFDFDEEVLLIGAAWYAHVAQTFLMES
jgi:amidohydrolase